MSKKEPAVAIGKKAVAKVAQKKPKAAAPVPKKVGGKKPVAKIELKTTPVAAIAAFKEVPVEKEADELEVKKPAPKSVKAKLPPKVSSETNALTRAKVALKNAVKATVGEIASSSVKDDVPVAPPAPSRNLDAGTFLQPMIGRKATPKATTAPKAAAGKVSFADLKAQMTNQTQVAKPAFDVSKYTTGRK